MVCGVARFSRGLGKRQEIGVALRECFLEFAGCAFIGGRGVRHDLSHAVCKESPPIDEITHGSPYTCAS
jgi:hypothetical protein